MLDTLTFNIQTFNFITLNFHNKPLVLVPASSFQYLTTMYSNFDSACRRLLPIVHCLHSNKPFGDNAYYLELSSTIRFLELQILPYNPVSAFYPPPGRLRTILILG